MYIKIYFDDKPVYLCNELDAALKELLHHPDAILVDEISSPAINAMLHEIKKPAFHAGVLLHNDLEQLRKSFFRHFQLVQAAGGLVLNEAGAVLLMYRRGKWDLPKGKLDPGESLETCAVREVEEETGVRQLSLGDKLGITYHTYDAFGKHILKETHWYRMQCSSAQPLVPQTEEDIEQLVWAPVSEFGLYTSNTYPSVAEILSAV